MMPMPGVGAYAAICQTFGGDGRLIHFKPEWEAEALVEMANTIFGPDLRLLFLNASYEIRAGRMAFDHMEGETFDERDERKLLIAGAAVFGRLTESSAAYHQFTGGDRAMASALDRLVAKLPDPDLDRFTAVAIPVGDLRTQSALVIVRHDDGRAAARYYRRPDIDRVIVSGAFKAAHRRLRGIGR